MCFKEKYEAVIGLEIHVELKTESKMFCPCGVRFGAPENTICCPVCMGFPGTLPVPNGEAVKKTAAAGLALGCSVAKKSRFARKNYFYPDLPKAYQISQDALPLCTGGSVEIIGDDGLPKAVRITRIHLEEDAGKLLHENGVTFADYNRCGIPLAEIVTEPDLSGAAETSRFVKKLKSILIYADISDCRMNEGSLRCDVNISVRKKGETALGTRAELKNLNSFRFIEEAIEYEYARQAALLESGGTVALETRRYNENTGKTYSLRPKESHADYRFFDEPDIGDIILTDSEIDAISKLLPELPDSRKNRYCAEGISGVDADVIIGERRYSDCFDEAVCGMTARSAAGFAKFFVTIIPAVFPDDGGSSVAPRTLCEIYAMLSDGKISNASAKKLAAICSGSNEAPADIAEREDMYLITDRDKILKYVKAAIEKSPKAVSDFKKGKTAAAKSVVGLVMSLSGGKADPKIAAEFTEKLLNE